MLKAYRGNVPRVDGDAFIAETAVLIGDVEVGADSSIWYGAVLRGDVAPIKIGRGSSIQDNAVLHCDKDIPTEIGDNVTVGHGAIVHSAVVGNNTLIGMGATVLSGAVIGKNCLIGAGALVKENAEVPDGSMLVGVPGRVIRAVTDEQICAITESSYDYIRLAGEYRQEEDK